MRHATRRSPVTVGTTVWLLAVLGTALFRPPAARGQTGHRARAGLGDEIGEFLLVPFGGLPIISGMGGVQQALGVHILWPPESSLHLAARYEGRISSRDQLYDAASLDLVHKLAGNDTASISVTAGWARWDRRDFATVGIRARWPFAPLEEGGSTAVQGWFDLRYVVPSPRESRSGGGVWPEIMLAIVVPIRFD